MDNTLFFGDNLDILRTYIPDESVDLVYLDPPFNSKGAYNLLYSDERGDAPASTQAFKDSWNWADAARTHEDEILSGNIPDNVRRALLAFGHLLGTSPMMAYLTMMTPRLLEMRRVIRQTGSLYLHCDPSASHYLKIILDTIFGPENFRNEIVWRRTPSKGLTSRRLPRNHDVLLCYQVSEQSTWNSSAVFISYDHDALDEKTSGKYKHKDADGRIYRLSDLTNPNPDRPNLTYEFLGVTKVWRWTKQRMQAAYDAGLIVQTRPGTIPQLKRYLDEQRGRPLSDVWVDIDPLNSQAQERLGYPTQKPLTLLRRIIAVSSNPGDVVLDPFCGCGTAVDAAQELGRRWIGVDIAIRAISIIEERLHLNHGLIASVDYTVTGRPQDEEGARKLATQGGYFFEDWALDLVHAEPWTGKTKRGSDRGCDGVIVFRDNETRIPRRALVQVKSGKDRKSAHVRDLRGTMEREGVELGVFLTLERPTSEMELEASTTGFYTDAVTKSKVPRIQILTIGDMLERGARVELPEGSFIISRRIGRKTEVLPPAQRVLIPALPLSEPSNVIRVATKPAKERRKKG